MSSGGREMGEFLRDMQGTSVIELAMIAPVAAVLLLGMVDTSLGFTERLKTEQAAQRAVEKALAYSGAGSDYSSLDDEAATEAGVPVENVTMSKWMECDGVLQASFNTVCAKDEQISRHISIKIDNAYAPMFKFGPFGAVLGANNDGSIPYSIAAEVRIQ